MSKKQKRNQPKKTGGKLKRVLAKCTEFGKYMNLFIAILNIIFLIVSLVLFRKKKDTTRAKESISFIGVNVLFIATTLIFRRYFPKALCFFTIFGFTMTFYSIKLLDEATSRKQKNK
jgi:tellurite resistance protein TehA-like permease